MTDMTLQQAGRILRQAANEKYAIGSSMAEPLADAIDAHLARLSDPVSDDDVCDAMTIIFGNQWKPHCDEYFRVKHALTDFADFLARRMGE